MDATSSLTGSVNDQPQTPDAAPAQPAQPVEFNERLDVLLMNSVHETPDQTLDLNFEDFKADKVVMRMHAGVEVTRAVEVTATRGVNVVNIKLCPAWLFTTTPKASLCATVNSCALLDICWEEEAHEHTLAIREQKSQLNRLQTLKDEAEDELQSWKIQEEILIKMSNQFKDHMEQERKAGNAGLSCELSMVEFLHINNGEHDNVAKKLYEIHQKLINIETEMEDLRKQKFDYNYDVYYCLTYSFVAAAEGKQPLQLTYSVPDYKWDVSYSFHFVTTEPCTRDPLVCVTNYLNYCHQLDETWENVVVEISTENLSTQRLENYKPPKLELTPKQPTSTWNKLLNCLANDSNLGSAVLTGLGKPTPPEILPRYVSTRIKVAERQSFQTGKRCRIVAHKFFTECEKTYLCCPTFTQSIYCWMKFANNGLYTLLPGKAAVTLNNVTNGHEIEIGYTEPSDIIECYAGVERGPRVHLSQNRSRTSSSLFRGAKTTFDYEVILNNFSMQSPMTIRVMLLVPTPKDERVTLHLGNTGANQGRIAMTHKDFNCVEQTVVVNYQQTFRHKYSFWYQHPEDILVLPAND